ncbi:MAG: Hsp70 family protein [Myxococcaceae bacterium]|nr:Hsp70 family protein [Myxococcaceae bacterium]
MPACGLDFGTSNSAVALASGEVLRLEPSTDSPRLSRSVLFFPEETTETLTGAEAIERYLQDNSGRFIQSMKTWLPATSFARTQIRNRTLALEELIAIFLRRLRQQASAASGTELDEVVMGRPARFSTDLEIDRFAEQRLRKAAELSGFKKVSFVIEPIAAALAYESTLTRDEQVLVIDFGAGTTDLTLMRLGPSHRVHPDRRVDVVASSGLYVGGDRFDAAIMKHKLLKYFGQGTTYAVGFKRMPIPTYVMSRLLSWHEMSLIREKSTRELIELMLKTSDDVPAIAALHDLVMYNLGYRLFRAIEQAKIALSSNPTAVVRFDDERVHIEEKITRAELDSFCAPLLAQLEACTDQLLAPLPKPLTIDSVFLTGGSSQIPAVQQLFSKKFGAERIRTADAFTSVAEGLGRASDAAFKLSAEG